MGLGGEFALCFLPWFLFISSLFPLCFLFVGSLFDPCHFAIRHPSYITRYPPSDCNLFVTSADHVVFPVPDLALLVPMQTSLLRPMQISRNLQIDLSTSLDRFKSTSWPLGLHTSVPETPHVEHRTHEHRTLTLTSNIDPKIDPRAYPHPQQHAFNYRSMDLPISGYLNCLNVNMERRNIETLPGTLRQNSPKMKTRTPGNVHPGRPTTSPTASSRLSPPRIRIRSWPLTCPSSGSIFGSMRMCFFFFFRSALNPCRVSRRGPNRAGTGTDVSIVLSCALTGSTCSTRTSSPM